MARLHELLAAEKTPTAAWNQLQEETLKKFGNADHYFKGHTRTLKMIEDTAESKAIEDAAREEKPVTTTVVDTLQYALDIFARAEDLQFQKNKTNQKAVATVMWRDKPLLVDVPVDSLLGLEARLTRLRQVFVAIPTLDASKEWARADQIAQHVWQTRYPDETVKTDKQLVPITLKEASDKHPAQVQGVQKDVVVGKFTMIRRSGEATALQKAEAIKRIDELVVEIKRARMRANETEVQPGTIAAKIVELLLEPLTD